MSKINLEQAFSSINKYWDPHIAGDVNDSQIKLAKIKGEFDWHTHQHEDEAFLVVRGQFNMELRDQTILLSQGELYVVPRGVEHRPVAGEECWIMLIEPASTVNTGNVTTEKTKTALKRF